jgi:hypothetical protein
VALAAAGYGIVEVAAHFAQTPAEAPAATAPQRQLATQSATQLASAELRPAATDVLSPATSELQRVAASGDRIESPRECALEEGITEACSFN